ncbi:MAG: DUF3570 domain-containing protein [Saprospiraceae bacterium]|nr:DUF3570 domain-containing protein [Saprospiraceae bacterium]MCB0543609.1 DUF3570 domain-containing protein [Saprospiraceae bacterium]MCB0577382.1 DUF3570 domain-containing protein [Saprospiraceae bacterium]
MFRKNMLLGFLMSWLSSFGQRQDSTGARKKALSQTDIDIVYAQYLQNGNHSAVTGGIGTENLQVYAPEISLTQRRDSVQVYSLQAGVDMITSASTDKIDFIVSSASREDVRGHAAIGYERRFGKRGWWAGAGTSVSVESDYLSFGGSIGIRHTDPSQNREISLRLETFFDDMRWALFRSDKKATLIYPKELRGTEWFDRYRRNSYNLSLNLYQTLNRRMAVGIFSGLTYQQGLLSTPFHRVYFNDGSLKVENLPTRRVRVPLGLQWNYFALDRLILRSYYRFYWDDFGITAHTIDLETPVRIDPLWTISPFFRFYTQTQADDFRAYGQHSPEQTYYTSDYDLSAFQSYKAGLGLRYAPYRKLMRRIQFNAVELRYAWYRRSDGLVAHMITLLLEGSHGE